MKKQIRVSEKRGGWNGGNTYEEMDKKRQKQAYKHKWKAAKTHFSARGLRLQFALWCILATNTNGCFNTRAFRHYHQTYGPAYKLYFCSLSEPGLRSRSRGRSWRRVESTVSTRVRVGAGVGKILPTSTLVRSCRITTVNRHWLAERFCIVPKTLEGKKGDWQRGSKVEASFSDRISCGKRNRR